MAKKSRSTMPQSQAAQHPDPARPDDPTNPNPLQQETAAPTARAMPGGGKSSSAQSKQQSAQSPWSGQMSASPFGDPSPGDESPRDLPLPRAADDDTAALMSNWRKHRRAGRQAKPQHSAQSAKRSPSQSGGESSAFGDPSPGDENPRPIQPRGGQRS